MTTGIDESAATTAAHAREVAARPPLVLFDGVCNLCNAWVRWIVRHDRQGVFHFAALQSTAAQAPSADAPAGAPRTIVLIDERGRHVESEAVIRIAGRLGWPWRLLAVARVLPRPARDAAYRWVARNRYRWFGQQNACLAPAPGIRERFVDADEWPMPVPTPYDAVARSAPRAGAATAAFLHRLVLVYFAVYIFPFPIGLLPFTSRVGTAYDDARQHAVAWLAQALLGIHITVFPNGSGDTTYNYVELLVTLVAAVAIAAAWTLRTGGRPVASRTSDVVRSYVRYFLAAMLFSYGWSKVVPVQMPAPGPDRLLNTIGNTSPMGLVWTLMGASVPYQVFAGLGEVTAALLLFGRRTALAGSLAAAAVLTNVVMLNFCFDVPVKLFSSHLLAMAVFLATPHAVRLAAVLVFNLPAQPVVLRPHPIERTALRRLAIVARVGLFVAFGIMPVFDSISGARQYGFLVKRTPFHGTWHVDDFAHGGVAGRANEDSVRWVTLAINDVGIGAIQRASGATRRCALTLDHGAHTMKIQYRGGPAYTLAYAEPAAGQLRVNGEFEGAAMTASLHRLPDDSSLLLGRGFHWINEFPLNR